MPTGHYMQLNGGISVNDERLTMMLFRDISVDKSRSRAQGGAGLGLSLCNEIVRYHNSELKFESKPGKGTCVSVILKGGAE